MHGAHLWPCGRRVNGSYASESFRGTSRKCSPARANRYDPWGNHYHFGASYIESSTPPLRICSTFALYILSRTSLVCLLACILFESRQPYCSKDDAHRTRIEEKNFNNIDLAGEHGQGSAPWFKFKLLLNYRAVSIPLISFDLPEK